MKQPTIITCVTLALLLFVAVCCKTEEVPEINFSPIKRDQSILKTNITRLDKQLFETIISYQTALDWVQSSVSNAEQQMFVNEILGLKQLNDSVKAEALYSFVSNVDWKNLQQEILSVYANTDALENELNEALKQICGAVEGVSPPQIFTYNSGFNVGIYPDTSVLGIGLEWFLGDTSAFLKRLAPESFPMYKKRKMTQKYVVIEALKGWMLYNLFRDKFTENMLEYIVFEGKVLAALEALFPDKEKFDLIGYSEEQWMWIKKNETYMWKDFVKEELVYSTDQQELLRMTMDGPFTSGMSQSCPPKLGTYLGWQMVKDYVAQNKDIPLQQLFFETPTEDILRAYKP